MASQFSKSRLLWTPPNPRFTSVDVFRRRINHKRGLNLKDYHDLHKYSVEDYTFWQDLWQFLGIVYSVPPQKILENGKSPELPTWFPGAKLNYAENLLHRCDDSIACTAADELGKVVHYSFRELREMVRAMAVSLRVHGLQPGDRVAAICTNSINAVVVALATSSIGAIFSSTATDMGAQGILDRYIQIQPKFIFSETEIVYAGKTINLLAKLTTVVQSLISKGLVCVILSPSIKTGEQVQGARNVPHSVSLEEFLTADDGGPLVFEQLPFTHPVYILYSSGTSGSPKCIVHSGGGALLQSKKEISLGFGIDRNDTYFQYTTTGWMMWPFMLGGLACGARIVLYDGSPFHPDVRKFLKFVSDQEVSSFGTSPRFLSEVQGKGINPLEIAPFSSLRQITCTGAVFTTSLHEWTQVAFGPWVKITSTSGGTDIFSSFVTGVPTLPIYAGEIQGKSLGHDVRVFDPVGNNIENTGNAGELVCVRPHPSLPVCFWGDESGEKFRQAYYDVYPGVWRHGDFIAINPVTKGIVMLGRSDGVLNPSGIRFGSAEIYTVLEAYFASTIDDALCIGQRRPGRDTDERVLLFLKMRDGVECTRTLRAQIRAQIREALSARHVPKWVGAIADIPYTVNGKKIEIAVKQVVSGVDVKPSGTVANPEALQLYYKYREIERFIEEEEEEAKLKTKL